MEITTKTHGLAYIFQYTREYEENEQAHSFQFLEQNLAEIIK